MSISNLEALINRTGEIKTKFKKEYTPTAFYNGQSAGINFNIIHNDPAFIKWKSDIEYELDQLPVSGLIENLKTLFGSMSGWDDEKKFAQIEAKLQTLKEHLPEIVAAASAQSMVTDDVFSEDALCENILKALLNVQKNPIYRGKKEDEVNDGIRDNLSMVYDVKDQTRQGESESGLGAGEVDLLLCKNGMAVAIVEALRLGSLNRDNLKEHIDKALTKYDPVGCLYAFIFTYYIGVNFDAFWQNFLNYLREYDYPYVENGEPADISTGYAESRHAKTSLNRSGKNVNLHFYAIHIR